MRSVFNIDLLRSTAEVSFGHAISKVELRPDDLVFFHCNHYVAVDIGGDKLFMSDQAKMLPQVHF